MTSVRDDFISTLVTTAQKEFLLSILKKTLEDNAKLIEQQLVSFDHVLLRRKKLTGEVAKAILPLFNSTTVIINFCTHVLNFLLALEIAVDASIVKQLKTFRVRAELIEQEIRLVNAMLQTIEDATYPDSTWSPTIKAGVEERFLEIKDSSYEPLIDNRALLSAKMETKRKNITRKKEGIGGSFYNNLEELVQSGILSSTGLSILNALLADPQIKENLSKYRDAKKTAATFTTNEKCAQFTIAFFNEKDFFENTKLNVMRALFDLLDDAKSYTTRRGLTGITDAEMGATLKAIEFITPHSITCHFDIQSIFEALQADKEIKSNVEATAAKFKQPKPAATSHHHRQRSSSVTGAPPPLQEKMAAKELKGIKEEGNGKRLKLKRATSSEYQKHKLFTPVKTDEPSAALSPRTSTSFKPPH